MVDQAGWSTEQISLVLTIWGVLVVLMQLIVIPLLLRRFQEIQLAIVGGVLGMVAFVLLALFPTTGPRR